MGGLLGFGLEYFVTLLLGRVFFSLVFFMTVRGFFYADCFPLMRF